LTNVSVSRSTSFNPRAGFYGVATRSTSPTSVTPTRFNPRAGFYGVATSALTSARS